MTFAKKYAVLAILCATTFAIVGCGKGGSGSRSGLVKASGTVVYQGQPVAGATIEMRPVDESITNGVAVGLTDDKGVFTLTTDRPNDGALPGKYKTVVKKQVEMIDGMTKEEYLKEKNPDGNPEFTFDKGKLKVEDTLPSKYSDPLNTPLEVEVPKGGSKTLEIVLED
ncbi:MAG: hypothetical protein IJM30_06825 [Thermoguttaceae bacterium]|nr:hypothetical protein [Thermoguttaceae bacterium]